LSAIDTIVIAYIVGALIVGAVLGWLAHSDWSRPPSKDPDWEGRQ
jgi:hypothetical protein